MSVIKAFLGVVFVLASPSVFNYALSNPHDLHPMLAFWVAMLAVSIGVAGLVGILNAFRSPGPGY